MVEWTDDERAIITSIFSTLDYDDVGPKALSRYIQGLCLPLRNEVEGCNTFYRTWLSSPSLIICEGA